MKIYSRLLPGFFDTKVICPISLMEVPYPLDFPYGAYLDDMRVSHVTRANCVVKVEIVIPVPFSAILNNVKTFFIGKLFRYVVVIFHHVAKYEFSPNLS